MKKHTKNHSDCANLVPVDVAKGLCVPSNRVVMIDSPPCPEFSPAPKCRICRHFSNIENDSMGVCSGFEKSDPVYPDLGAKNCVQFREKTV